MDPDVYPTSRVLKPNIPYRIPFLFVIPERLLPQSCDHEVSNGHVRQTHTQLPPTFGDSAVSGSSLNNIAHNACDISYAIRARIFREPQGMGSNRKQLADISRELHVVPMTNHGLLCKTSKNSPCHTIQKAKRISHGLMKGKQGRLLATVFQPEPVLLEHTSIRTHTVDTVTMIHLRFDPQRDEQPPQLCNMRSKLGVRAFYGSTPWTRHPTNAEDICEEHHNMTLEHIPLSSFSTASMKWTKHSVSDELAYTHRPTGPSEPEPLLPTPGDYNGDVYYTTSINVPIYLPRDRQFISTFYSCLISRAYTLDLSLSYTIPKARLLRHSLNLKVPVSLNVSVPGLWDVSQDVICSKEDIQSCLEQGLGDWEHEKIDYLESQGNPIHR